MEFNFKKFIRKSDGKPVIISASGAKEILADKSAKNRLKFVGDCSENGQLKPTDGNFFEEASSPKKGKVETSSVEDIIAGKGSEKPLIDERLNNAPPPVQDEEIIEFKYDDTLNDEHFEENDPD